MKATIIDSKFYVLLIKKYETLDGKNVKKLTFWNCHYFLVREMHMELIPLS